eukprot:1143328-Pelagomonas_calceolata.AAC.12
MSAQHGLSSSELCHDWLPMQFDGVGAYRIAPEHQSTQAGPSKLQLSRKNCKYLTGSLPATEGLAVNVAAVGVCSVLPDHHMLGAPCSSRPTPDGQQMHHPGVQRSRRPVCVTRLTATTSGAQQQAQAP